MVNWSEFRMGQYRETIAKTHPTLFVTKSMYEFYELDLGNSYWFGWLIHVRHLLIPKTLFIII